MIKPVIDSTAFLAKGCAIYGNVTLKADVSVWYNATIRAMEEPIVIGEGSNVQDNAVVHVDAGFQVNIGANVTIGHGAIIHGCNIGNNTLVGMGAIILNGASIGNNCIIGAGALVTQNAVIPDNSLVLGSPAKVIRPVTEAEVEKSIANAKLYVEEIAFFRECERIE
ncbi:MAG: gamma carbonic anhydrase family protein [Lachnospiraceae bacterium]|nr:gamma carbonic anhydrase family protein [Lachnospiraceae bacterium]